jgi:hypothetical protein
VTVTATTVALRRFRPNLPPAGRRIAGKIGNGEPKLALKELAGKKSFDFDLCVMFLFRLNALCFFVTH